MDTFKKNLKFLKESEFWSKSQLEAYQLNQLKELIDHCHEYVPYYRDIFDKHNITSESIQEIEDIKRIPLLSKEIIKSRYQDFVADEKYTRGKNLINSSTSGSTGIPLKLVGDEESSKLNLSQTVYYMEIFGLNPWDYRSIRLRGDIIPESLTVKGEFWKQDNEKKLSMSSYHINSDTIEAYVKKINHHKPDYIHAYPSCIALLAEYIEKFNLQVKCDITCIFCDSERLFQNQREIIERIFDAPAYNVYSHVEGAVQGVACNHSQKLHILPQVGITEVLDSNGTDVKKPGEKGEIVVTGFYRKIMPLIRYKTGDEGVYSKQACSCEREYLLLERVNGRLRQFVVDKIKRVTPMFSFSKFTTKIVDQDIIQYQFYQDKPGTLVVKYMSELNDDREIQKVENSLFKATKSSIGDEFKVVIKKVDVMSRTKTGKLKYLDQKLNVSLYI